jgi:FG-GAP repeat protein
MLPLLMALLAHAGVSMGQAPVASRPADIAFRMHMIDPGFSESVAVADFNKDGRLDILSAEYWYASSTPRGPTRTPPRWRI